MENKNYVLKTSKGEIVSQKTLVANSILSRMKGLMFSLELPNCDALLLAPCNSIHTFFMLYKIDVLFLDKNFKVIKAIYDLSPWRMTWIYFKSYQVLEMKAGTMKKDIKAGDVLEAICIN